MLKVGEKFPYFQLANQNNKTCALKDYLGKWLVLYVYPKDDTPGCTLEGKGFSQKKSQFEKLNTNIVGVSQDDVDSHKDFCDKYSFTIDLLADPEAGLLTATGVGKKLGKFWNRTTFVIDPKGIIKKVYENVNPDGHDAAVLRDIKELQSSGRAEISA